MAEFIQYSITGLAVGLVYALIALGFALIYKSSGVANLALGELVLLFSWVTYAMLVQFEFPYWLAFPLVIVAAIGVGWMIERFALRRLIAQPILSVIAVTLGVAYFLRGLITFIWPWSIKPMPHFFPEEPFHFGPGVVSQEYIWAGVTSLVIFGMLTLFFKYHKMGIAMRATADDQLAIQACGVPVTRIFSTSWVFASVVAAVGGVLLSSIVGCAHIGLAYAGLRTFSVVILGGLDSFIGCIVAGPIIGLCENLGGGYISPLVWGGVKDIIPFVIIILVMFFKPYGLFGEVRIERI